MEKNIESHLKEIRVFKPSRDFAKKAHIGSLDHYRRMHRESIRQPEKFWAREARNLTWQRTWKKVLEWKEPFAKWFVGGKTECFATTASIGTCNAAQEQGRHHLGRRAGRYARAAPIRNSIAKSAVRQRPASARHHKGDRVTIYMPMVPEAAIAMLACARIGATHSVVFGGFSADALADRNNDAKAKLLITADGGYRRGKLIPLKANVDEALAQVADRRRSASSSIGPSSQST